MKAIPSLAAMPLLLMLAACALGPDGTPPPTPTPPRYGALEQPAETVAAQGAAQRFIPAARPVAEWWKRYQSPALNALVAEGLANSPDLAAVEKRLDGARQQMKAQIGDSLFPSLDGVAEGSRGRRIALPTGGPPTALYNLFVGQLQAQYTFDIFGAVRYANASLEASVNRQAWQLEAARRALAANIVTGAISAAAYRAQVEATERLVALAGEDASDTGRRSELGALPQTDTFESRRSARALAAQLPALRARWLETRHALAVLLGRSPDQAPGNLDFASLAVPTDVPVLVPSELLSSRPDIQAADAALKGAAADAGLATARLYPSLSLSATLGQGGFAWSKALDAAGGIWTAGASITMPLFHGGALRAQRQAALDDYEAAIADYKQTVLAAFRNVADALAGLEQDALALASADAARHAASRAWADTRRRVELGALPPSAARAREQQYLSAQVNAIGYANARLNDTAMLFNAMGSPVAEAE